MSPETCVRRGVSYWTTCSCPPCVVDRRRKRKIHSLGTPYRVPAQRAADILAAKIDDGWTSLAIASASGLQPGYFQRHITARKRGLPMPHLGPTVAAAIVGMGAPTAGQINARGPRRRLQALSAIGHSLDAISLTSGVGFTTLAMIRASETERVKACVASKIAAAYGRLEMVPGANSRVRREARAKGWLPPLAWMDIDDPNERPDLTIRDHLPDPVVVDRILAGDFTIKPTRSERYEVIARWPGSDGELERRSGWNVARDKREMRAAEGAENAA